MTGKLPPLGYIVIIVGVIALKRLNSIISRQPNKDPTDRSNYSNGSGGINAGCKYGGGRGGDDVFHPAVHAFPPTDAAYTNEN